jgi:hypothetical protein
MLDSAFKQVFTPEVISRLSRYSPGSSSLGFRISVLDGGTNDSERKRALWSDWLECARSSGLLYLESRDELVARLTGVNDDNFRSALAECMACFFLVRDLGICIEAHPIGRNRRVLEFAAHCGAGTLLNFEVKSPRSTKSFAAQGGSIASAVDPSLAVEPLQQALEQANKQFAPNRANVLVLALPEVGEEFWCLSWETQILVQAFYGHELLVTQPCRSSSSIFQPSGKFLKRAQGVPRFTRIGAVICVEDIPPYPRLQAVVLHNPHAIFPISEAIWKDCRQLIARSGEMRWNSDKELRE